MVIYLDKMNGAAERVLSEFGFEAGSGQDGHQHGVGGVWNGKNVIFKLKISYFVSTFFVFIRLPNSSVKLVCKHLALTYKMLTIYGELHLN